MICTTTELCFGPIFGDEDVHCHFDGEDHPHGMNAHDVCQAFIDWLPADARKYPLPQTDWDQLRADFLDRLRCHKIGQAANKDGGPSPMTVAGAPVVAMSDPTR